MFPNGRSGSPVRALGLAFSTSGGYPTNGDTTRATRNSGDDSPLSETGIPALDRIVTTPDVPILVNDVRNDRSSPLAFV